MGTTDNNLAPLTGPRIAFVLAAEDPPPTSAAAAAAPDSAKSTFSVTAPAAKSDPAPATTSAALTPTRHYIRALIGLYAQLGVNKIIYAYDKRNAVDQELPLSLSTIGKKLEFKQSAVSFDTNRINGNAGDHPFAGTLYYLNARELSNLSLWWSCAFAQFGSFNWETWGEPQEKFGISDQYMTGFGGPAIGESLHQVIKTLRETPWSLSVKDRFGLKNAPPHKFEVSLADVETSNKLNDGSRTHTSATRVELSVESNNLPHFGQPGEVRAGVYDGGAAKLKANVALTDGIVTADTVQADADVAGYFRQSIRATPDGKKGYSLFFGDSMGFEHSNYRTSPTAEPDHIAVSRVLGPTMDLVVYRGATQYRLSMNISGDLGMISSLVFDQWRKQYPGGVSKWILQDQDYQYSIGTTAKLSAEVRRGAFDAGVDLKHQRTSSIDGFDRRQAEVTTDFHENNAISSAEAHAGASIGVVHVGVSASARERQGEAADVKVKNTSTAVAASVGVDL